jgi:hypothetical protein
VDDQSAPAQRQKPGPPSTSSVLWAEWRRGLKDLQNIVLNPWQGQTATHEEPGTIGNPTHMEVYQDRQDKPPKQETARADSRSPTPSQIAEEKSSRSGGGDQQQKQNATSPSDIAEGKDQQQGQQQAQNDTKKQNRGRGT